ncbi:hypothetical protein CSC2_17550 [Clostridium zeae]|uniref:Tail spike domain-containing protein n=1 Tax=Clostridium zeae TaxID=2759022 RepID=A0ABQ1E966_9CLOT|nr:phage tail spike protein [Clostridium zeae]GFZ31229.1 hypothetical protein CSC2_17550 [Clostridium zeae]
MITVHDRLITDFDNNGLAILTNVMKAEVEEIINSDYKLTLVYPLADKKAQYLVKDNIIKVPTPLGTDLFRIYKTRKSLQDSNNIECLCRHISYDLERNFMEDVRPTNLNGYNALNWLKNNTAFPCNFSFSSDIQTLNTAYYVRKNLLEAIMSTDDNSFLSVWGGELERRNFNFNVLTQLGSDRGFKISQGKNMTGIEESIEGTEVTRVMTTGRDDNDQPLLIPEKYVDSPLINNYISPSIKTVDFPNIKVSREDAQTDYPNNEAVYEELRRQVNLMYSEQHIDRPSVNYTVDFADLSRTDLYKDLSILQQLYIGDICSIYSNKLKLDLKARLRSYAYDCILKKYTKLELGDYTKRDYAVSNILNNKIITVATDNYVIGNKLKQALGGHVIKREGEILICDTDNIATAAKVWRWNLNGLGYSSTGYNGDFPVAITMDGEIVANFIKTGELDASLIKVGVLKSENEITWINMNDGTFNFANKFKFDGSQFFFDGDLITDLDGSVITGRIKSVDGTVDIDLSNGGFRIGGRSGDTAIHTNSYSRWSHSNGTYSQSDAEGFFNIQGNQKRGYHFLSLAAPGAGTQSTGARVQLPDQFKGKDFDIAISLSKIMAPGSVFPNTIDLFTDTKFGVAYCYIINKNIQDGWFEYASWGFWDYIQDNVLHTAFVPLECSYVVTA